MSPPNSREERDLGGFPEVSVPGMTPLSGQALECVTLRLAIPIHPISLPSPTPQPWILSAIHHWHSEGPGIDAQGLPLNGVKMGFALENPNGNVNWLSSF